MTERQRVNLGEIQETLLIPLYGRAVETRKRRPLLCDPVAVEIVESLDYDFARFDGGPSLLGSVLRTMVFDEWARAFLGRHPAGTVIEIGSGLNTRFERLDNGRLHWVDLDLPDVVALRRQFFTDSSRRHTVAASVLEQDWLAVVATCPGPYLFLSEAVLIYLAEVDVQRTLTQISVRFPTARLALDTAGPHMVATQDRHDALSKVTARMRWSCDDPAQLEQWGLGLRLVASRTLAQPPAAAPVGYRLMMPLIGAVWRRKFSSYRLNLYQCGVDQDGPAQH
ncbi:MAG: class I SAM-dependent methyltransferase [Pseudonocardiaceae bacterium]